MDELGIGGENTVVLQHVPGRDRNLCRHAKKPLESAGLRVSLRAASQAFGLPDPSPSARSRMLVRRLPDFGSRKNYDVTKNCESKLYQNMAACGSTRCRSVEATKEKNNDDAPPSADTMATFNDDTFLSRPPFLHNSAS